jgi:hypothetical protein
MMITSYEQLKIGDILAIYSQNRTVYNSVVIVKILLDKLECIVINVNDMTPGTRMRYTKESVIDVIDSIEILYRDPGLVEPLKQINTNRLTYIK